MAYMPIRVAPEDCRLQAAGAWRVRRSESHQIQIVRRTTTEHSFANNVLLR